MAQIPVIDLSRARTGNSDERKLVADKINQACKEIGFITIKGHGVNRSVFLEAYESLTAFFALTLETKELCTTSIRPCPFQTDGYNALLGENAHALMGKEGPSDYVEKFSMGKSIMDNSLRLPFPDDPSCADLRKNMKRYYEACQEVSTMMAELFALALDLPEDHFVTKLDKSWDNLRWHNYPAREDKFEHDGGVGEHADVCFITMVSNIENGMEARTRDGQWIDVKTDDIDQFMVNIGDLVMRWSNDEWLSNLHRVKLTDVTRRSMVFIKFANDDALIETFPKFLKNGKSKYDPITFTQFISEKAADMYGAEFMGSGKVED